MGNDAIEEGIRMFAETAGARIAGGSSDITYQLQELNFSGERYSTYIGVEAFGKVLSYSSYCGGIPDVSWAPVLLKRNWGGVEDTALYFSVHYEDRQPMLVLETRQLLQSSITAQEVASLLGTLREQVLKAKESLRKQEPPGQ